MDCSLTGSSVHGIFQARVLEWGAIAFSDTTFLKEPNNLVGGGKEPNNLVGGETRWDLLQLEIISFWIKKKKKPAAKAICHPLNSAYLWSSSFSACHRFLEFSLGK